MPFTLSHAAAALPFRRARLVTSALLIGTFAPDLEYFIRLQAGGGWGHTLTGAFTLDLPLGLATLWLFHRFVKVPLVYLLPDSVRARLTDELAPFAFGPPLRFLLIVLSMLIGIATHFVWDASTHDQYWLVQHVGWLHQLYHLSKLGWWRGCEHAADRQFHRRFADAGCVVPALVSAHCAGLPASPPTPSPRAIVT